MGRMNEDHELVCLLSKLQSLFPSDSRLGAGGKGGNSGFVKGGVMKQTPKKKTLTQEQLELQKKAIDEIMPRLLWKWKYINKVYSLPRDPKKRTDLIDRCEALAQSMVPAWKFKMAKLEELKRDSEVFENDQKTKKRELQDRRHAARKKVQDLERDIKNLEEKRKKIDTDYELLVKKRNELPGKKEALEYAEQGLKNMRITTNEELYSPEYKECRKALYDLDEKIQNKKNYIRGLQTKQQSTDVAREELGWIKEKYYTLKKIHDEFLIDECGKIIDHYRA